ncbi:MAG: carbamoyl phosphate synthase small subunit [Clostridia bacterium]|nr:carbamoyl phosphate synthase small subunit [Clostridia bacterium]
MKKAYLVLENEMVFEGYRIGSEKDSVGELVFNTGVVGYIEMLTDASYYGQIVMQTFPLVGNYGMIEEDIGSKPALFGYVVRELCEEPSNFRTDYTLDKFLKDNDIPGICGVDTRALTRIIRENGVMNAKICSEVPTDFTEIKNFKIVNAVSAVSGAEKTVEGEGKKKVALINYGEKTALVNELTNRGCEVTVYPHDTKAEDINGYDGIVLSNGPGDPSENTFEIEQIAKLCGKLPIFAVGLGHQLLALAVGGKTAKLKYGHRGGNQPVKDLVGTRTYITSQNHGYVVESVPNAKVIYENANDGTCEGLEYEGIKAFSVQFNPETANGPHDTGFLFDRFIKTMGGEN